MLRVLTVPRVQTVLVLTVLMVPHVLAQTAPQQAPRDGVISGRVVDAGTGRPISAAIVSVSQGVGRENPAGPLGGRVLTGADGRFVFRDLAPSSFSVTAIKGGYADGASGRRRPGGPTQAVVLTPTQRTANVDVRMWKNGAIAGMVIDEAGEPLVGARVSALALTSAFPQPQYTPTMLVAYADDRGMYRFSNVTAGEYLVMSPTPLLSLKSSSAGTGGLGAALGRGGDVFATSDALIPIGRGVIIPPMTRDGRLQVYPPTLHPSASSPAQASRVSVASGEERTGIDVQLTAVVTARVSGIIAGASEGADVRIQLVPPGGADFPGEFIGPVSIPDSTGAFVFPAVVPGAYTLRATQSTTGPGGAQTQWIEMPLAVAGDTDGVTATMSPPLRVAARLQFEGNTPAPAIQAPRFTNLFSLDPVDRIAPAVIYRSEVSNDVVTLSAPGPGRYRVRVANSPPGWMFKAAMLNGVDVSETPFDVTRDVSSLVLVFTDRWSGMSGTVVGAGADTATVVAFTTDTQLWQAPGANPRRLRGTRATARGQFGFGSLPPGEYYVAAIRDEDAGDWRDPATLEAISRVATRVGISEGEHRTISLELQDVRR